MASSSSTSTTKPPRKHHVFLSFRGEDTRVGFTSHLYAALERKGIRTFVDDDLKRGEEIPASLVKAIEDSMISMIIFSKQYASSKWCLDELVKIVECRKIRGQIVIPIFYYVDPSDVRNQNGRFGDAFAEIVKRKALEMEEEQSFRAALKEAASISGHASRKIGSESKFIDEIVEDIFNKLWKRFPIHQMNFVGIDDRIIKIESFLEMESQKVRIVGIWGMGGIGKTTIAQAVYNKIFTEFEASLFVPNIREELKERRVVDLQTRIVSKLLDNKNSNTSLLSFENHFIKDGLRRKKVLIVLDDVDDPMDLQELLPGQCDSFGPESRILVTSRDRHVLRQVDTIYEVVTYEAEGLNNIEAGQLLKSKAFRKIDPTSDHKDVLDMMVDYAKGNPLALVVLGSALCDRSKEDWYSKLNGLEKDPEVKILHVLRISYDGLSKEKKNVFLDIACYFRGMDRDRVTTILEKKYSSVHYCISVLIDKSLIIEPVGNILQVHDLLLDMTYSIVREESENPGERSRLFDPEDIYHVLEENEGTKAVKGIRLDMPESREMQLKSDAFAGMRCLEVLIIKGKTSKLKLPNGGFKCLPQKLRYFRWDGYRSRSLSEDFCAPNLVDFDFSHSKVEELWSGQQELVNLRRINLSCSDCLTKLPDLSKAKQLEHVDLKDCASLMEVPSYFQYFEKLKELSLDRCYNVQSIPRKINSNNMKVLSLQDCSNIKKSPEIPANIEYLDLSRTAIEEFQQSFGGGRTQLRLSGCSNITKFPKISGNIKELYLDGIAIEEVPSSIHLLTNLRLLHMSNCNKLSILPDNICKLKSLQDLVLSGCSKLESFPEIKEPMEDFEYLNLSGTAITELPLSIRFLTNLFNLNLRNCKKLSGLPNSICELEFLQYLRIDGCSKLESLPENMEPMKSLRELHLSETAIRELPELSPSLYHLTANNCESLEIISSSALGDSMYQSCFANCFKLDQKALMADMQLKIQFGKIARFFRMVLPGSEIPQWFSYQSRGSSITIQFPSNPPNLKAIALCFVVVHPGDLYEPKHKFLELGWQAKINNGENDDVITSSDEFYVGDLKIPESDHMYLCYQTIRQLWMKNNHRNFGHDGISKYFGQEVTFEFTEGRSGFKRPLKVKKCGVHLLFDENADPLSISYEDSEDESDDFYSLSSGEGSGDETN